MKELRIATEPTETDGRSVQIVRLAGYIDAHSYPRFEEEMLALVNQGHYRLLLDLHEVTYICSTALGLMLQLFRQVRQNAGDLVVARVPEKIANILNLLGISKLIRAFRSEQEALQCLASADEQRR